MLIRVIHSDGEDLTILSTLQIEPTLLKSVVFV